MGAIELLGSLISEHGSSTVLRERLELLREQFERLERENASLKKTVFEHEQEMKSAMETIARLHLESAEKDDREKELKSRIDSIQGEISQVEDRIIQLLTSHSSVLIVEVARHMNCKEQTALHHLSSLVKRGLVGKFSSYVDDRYHLTFVDVVFQ